MSLRFFSDPFVQNEVGAEYGNYVGSYASEHRDVEAHLFEKQDKLVVYVTKSRASVAEAQRVAEEALRQHQAGGGPEKQSEVVYDGYSLGHGA